MSEHSSPGLVETERNVVAPKHHDEPGCSVDLGIATTIGLSSPPMRPSMPSSMRWNAERLPVVDRANYAVAGEVAQGGIGRILSAHDARLDRRVALKEMLDAGGASEDRFVREALLTARLQHPSIVPVYEAGRWPSGEPFYAMKLVSGRPLSEIIDAARALDDRLPLLPRVLAVAEAVAFAHEKRIIHRDLKPANVLVGEYGETVVIDWGLAKDLADKHSEPAPSEYAPMYADAPEGLTMMGSVMGTPAYMPPEQAAGEAVDERADVYALGAILHHVLAGQAPYAGASGMKILGMVLAGPPPPLRTIQPGIPLDLLTIVDKAMARDPAERYPTAKELAEDLRRFLAGQLVGAHRYTARERAFRFARKHRAALAVATASFFLLAAGGAFGVSRIVAERDRATYEQHLAEAAHREAAAAEHVATRHADELTLVEARAAAKRDPNEALAWLKTLSPSFTGFSAARVIAADAWAHGPAKVLREQKGVINTIDISRDGRLLATASDDHTARIYDLATGTSRALVGHEDEVWFIGFMDDARRVVTTSKDKTIRIWDTATGAMLTTLRGHERAVVFALPFADGRLFSQSDDGTVREWNVEAGTNRVLAKGYDEAAKSMISPDGDHFLAAGGNGSVHLHTIKEDKPTTLESFDVTTNRTLVGGMFPMVWSPDRQHFAVGCNDGSVRIGDVKSSKVRVLEVSKKPVTRVEYSRDGQKLAAFASDGELRVFDLETGASRVLPSQELAVWVLEFSADGRTLATGGFDKVVRLYDLETGKRRELVGMRDTIMGIRFAPDGKRLIVSSSDATIRLYPLDSALGRTLGRHEVAALSLDVSPRGDRVVSGDKDGKVWVWPAKGDGPDVLLEGHRGPVTTVRFSPSGDTIATASVDGTARLWDGDGHEVRTFDTGVRGFTSLAYSSTGPWIGVGDASGGVWLWNVDSGEAWVVGRHDKLVPSIDFSPDGKQLLTGSIDRTARVWNLGSGHCRVLSGFDDSLDSVAFSPDGRMVAAGSWDHKLRLWDGDAPSPRVIDAGGYTVANLVFSPDGANLFSIGEDAVVRIWDVDKGALGSIWRGHEGVVRSLALSADGTTAVTGGDDKAVRLWDVRSGESRVLGAHNASVRAVALAPDGSWAASAGEDGVIQVWQDDLPRQPAELKAWIDGSVSDTIESISVEDETVP